jgi:hypothetical protein
LAFSNAATLTHRDRLSNGHPFNRRNGAAPWVEYKSTAAHCKHRAESSENEFAKILLVSRTQDVASYSSNLQ